MTKSGTVRALLTAIEQLRWDEAKGYLTEDFTFGGAVPQPLNTDAWLGVHKAFAAAMPDFSFNASDIREEQGGVRLRLQISGTQTRAMALPIPGAKNAAQASSNAGALGWELTEQEFAQISMLRVAGA